MHTSPRVRFEAVQAHATEQAGRKTTPELLKSAAEVVEAFAEDPALKEISISPDRPLKHLIS